MWMSGNERGRGRWRGGDEEVRSGEVSGKKRKGRERNGFEGGQGGTGSVGLLAVDSWGEREGKRL